MAETAYDVIQFGRQSVVGTPVAATKLFPGRAEAPELDRGYYAPEEDWGRLSDEQPARAFYGLRGATTRLRADVTFETIMDLLEMHAAGGVVPTGTNPYTWTYNADETSDTLKPYTIELGSTTVEDQWRLTGCIADELTLGYDQLAAPGNQPWAADASILALDRSLTARTPALSGPAVAETAEGHLTTISEGPTATVFGSLPELTGSLVRCSFASRRPQSRRPYGGATDVASAYGPTGKAGVTVEAEIRIGAGAKSSIHDIFGAAGSVVTERRWRIRAAGSGAKTLTIDCRVRFRVVGRGNRDGEAVYAVEGALVYDPTLGSRLQVVSAGTAVAAL